MSSRALLRRWARLANVGLFALFVFWAVVFLREGGWNPNMVMAGALDDWNFQVSDMLLFGAMGLGLYFAFYEYTLPLLGFTYGMSEFLSFLLEKGLVASRVVPYSYYYPANDYPANPMLVAAMSFAILSFAGAKLARGTDRQLALPPFALVDFVIFLIWLNYSRSFAIWWTHPVAYILQAGIVIPFARRIPK